MAEPYLERLSQMVGRLGLPGKRLGTRGVTLEPKHFFSGAALYANGKICASLSPRGFALKLPADTRRSLIRDGKGEEFRFFASGPIKREYVTLSESVTEDDEAFRKLMVSSINYVVGVPGSEAADKEG